jgi:hypothetical protein
MAWTSPIWLIFQPSVRRERVDEFIIYRRPLDDADIQVIMNALHPTRSKRK